MYNKIVVEDEVVMDLSEDTVDEDSLLKGRTAHDASGELIHGKLDPELTSVVPNTKYEDGIVQKGEGNPNKFWGTDGAGNPAWLPVNLASKVSVADFNQYKSEVNGTLSTLSTSSGNVNAELTALKARLNAVADSDDVTLDQLSEIVTYIKNNKSLIDNITTSKVSVADFNQYKSEMLWKRLDMGPGSWLVNAGIGLEWDGRYCPGSRIVHIKLIGNNVNIPNGSNYLLIPNDFKPWGGTRQRIGFAIVTHGKYTNGAFTKDAATFPVPINYLGNGYVGINYAINEPAQRIVGDIWYNY